MGSLSLLQGIFPTQGLNPGLPHCRQILYQLSHEGSPRILEWVAYPFSSWSSRPRDRTRVSCIAGGFFTAELSGGHGSLLSLFLLSPYYGLFLPSIVYVTTSQVRCELVHFLRASNKLASLAPLKMLCGEGKKKLHSLIEILFLH